MLVRKTEKSESPEDDFAQQVVTALSYGLSDFPTSDFFDLGVPPWVRLYAYTARALTTGPVSAAILNADWFNSSLVH